MFARASCRAFEYLHNFAVKEQNFKYFNFSNRSVTVTLSQPIKTPNNFHFIELVPFYTEKCAFLKEPASIYIYRNAVAVGSVAHTHTEAVTHAVKVQVNSGNNTPPQDICAPKSCNVLVMIDIYRVIHIYRTREKSKQTL